MKYEQSFVLVETKNHLQVFCICMLLHKLKQISFVDDDDELQLLPRNNPLSYSDRVLYIISK